MHSNSKDTEVGADVACLKNKRGERNGAKPKGDKQENMKLDLFQGGEGVEARSDRTLQIMKTISSFIVHVI